MNETLKLLYDRFYTPLPLAEYEQEVEACHRQLIERLEKPERNLVLQIIDTQNHIIEEQSLDSFAYRELSLEFSSETHIWNLLADDCEQTDGSHGRILAHLPLCGTKDREENR